MEPCIFLQCISNTQRAFISSEAIIRTLRRIILKFYIFFKFSISVNILDVKGSLCAEFAGFALIILELISTFYLHYIIY